MALSRELTANPGPAEDNLRQAYRYLDEIVAAPRIGTIGWCLGGRWSLRTALLLPREVDATVIYYGSVNVAGGRARDPADADPRACSARRTR